MTENPALLPLLNVRGNLVGLGPFLREHVDSYHTWLQDPETTIYANGTFELRTIERMRDSFSTVSKNEVVFAVYALPEVTLIGETLLMQIDHLQGTAMFGITIGRKDYWNKGYGTEATKLVLEYGFNFLNLHSIQLITTSFNARGKRAYEKAGFKVAGRLRECLLMEGKRYDDIYMDCLANEFVPPVPGWFKLPV